HIVSRPERKLLQCSPKTRDGYDLVGVIKLARRPSQTDQNGWTISLGPQCVIDARDVGIQRTGMDADPPSCYPAEGFFGTRDGAPFFLAASPLELRPLSRTGEFRWPTSTARRQSGCPPSSSSPVPPKGRSLNQTSGTWMSMLIILL